MEVGLVKAPICSEPLELNVASGRIVLSAVLTRRDVVVCRIALLELDLTRHIRDIGLTGRASNNGVFTI